MLNRTIVIFGIGNNHVDCLASVVFENFRSYLIVQYLAGVKWSSEWSTLYRRFATREWGTNRVHENSLWKGEELTFLTKGFLNGVAFNLLLSLVAPVRWR